MKYVFWLGLLFALFVIFRGGGSLDELSTGFGEALGRMASGIAQFLGGAADGVDGEVGQ